MIKDIHFNLVLLCIRQTHRDFSKTSLFNLCKIMIFMITIMPNIFLILINVERYTCVFIGLFFIFNYSGIVLIFMKFKWILVNI